MQSLRRQQTARDLTILTLATIAVNFLVWLPHIFKLNFYGYYFSEGFNTIYRNFDGLEYIIIAKSFYLPSLIAGIPQSLPSTYFASHFPGYSLLILIFAPLFGYLKSMLFVALLATIMATISFYFLIRDFKLTTQPVLLSLIFLILPARWLIVHSIGSAEPLFIFFVILSLYFLLKFEQTKNFLFIFTCGLLGALAQLTRPPAILLFISFGLYVLFITFKTRLPSPTKLILNLFSYFPLLLIPILLLLVFSWYNFAYNDFFAYFHSGDNIHLTIPPFQVFNKDQYWVGDIWLEDVVYIFALGFLGGILLLKQKLYPLAFFVLTYLAASTLVAHRDLSRYVLPVFPFLLIAFEKVLVSKEFRIVLAIIALAIYLYAQNFLLANISPIPNLQFYN